MRKIKEAETMKIRNLMIKSIIGFIFKIAILCTAIYFVVFHGILLTDPVEVGTGIVLSAPAFVLGCIMIFDRSKAKFSARYKDIRRETKRSIRRYRSIAA